MNYPEKVSPYLEERLESSNALKRQFLFSDEELNFEGGFLDPIGDQKSSQGSGIIHRYPNRILYTPTQACPVNCRYCFRKNELNQGIRAFSPNLENLKIYLNENPQVEEVILTGGDPLVLTNSKLEKILRACSEVGIKFLRFHTRTPIADPTRIDSNFIQLLTEFQDQFKRLFFVLHTNHPDELTTDVLRSLEKLQAVKVSLLTQSVLLKGVNDDATTLSKLFETLAEVGFSPYYLHHPDKVKGAMHFYLSEEEGSKIYSELRRSVSGWAVPHYIVDSPEASGKKLVVNQDI